MMDNTYLKYVLQTTLGQNFIYALQNLSKMTFEP